MDNAKVIFSHRELPIQTAWIMKPALNALIYQLFWWVQLPFIFIFPFAYLTVVVWLVCLVVGIVFSPLGFLFKYIARATFEYYFYDQQLKIKQGLISKTERTFQYATIQNIILSQGIVDKFFGLANVSIENASMGGGQMFYMPGKHSTIPPQGSSGNSVNINGLSLDHALYLKSYLLVKIKNTRGL